MLCIHSAIDRHLGCFYLLAAMNVGVQVSIRVPAFSPSVHIHRGGVAGTRGILLLIV